jgi:hypothetical protein
LKSNSLGHCPKEENIEDQKRKECKRRVKEIRNRGTPEFSGLAV